MPQRHGGVAALTNHGAQPDHNQHITASPFVTKSCFYAWGNQFNGRTGVRCNEMVHERWLAALETAKSNTNFRPCCGPTRRSAASRSRARVGGAALSLASPTHYTTPHRALSSHDLFLGHPHILFSSLTHFHAAKSCALVHSRDLNALLTPQTRLILATYKVLDHRSRATRTCREGRQSQWLLLSRWEDCRLAS